MNNELDSIALDVCESFKVIAPAWPLQKLIAVNPLAGFEDLPIEEALRQGAAHFEKTGLPEPMRDVNIQCIKWLQAFLDQGQATIVMPLRSSGFYQAWRSLAKYDALLAPQGGAWQSKLADLPQDPREAIRMSLQALGVLPSERLSFFKLMISTLPGWSSYIQYLTTWAESTVHPISQLDYLAVRLMITAALWPDAKVLLVMHEDALSKSSVNDRRVIEMQKREAAYRSTLLDALLNHKAQTAMPPKAQWVFCIDVRSEPLRRALESVGPHETLGFAGFFGLPIQIKQAFTGCVAASCPVLIKPKHEVCEQASSHEAYQGLHLRYALRAMIKQLYQSVKYTFTAPLGLVESMGVISACALLIRTFIPGVTRANEVRGLMPRPEGIPFHDQCEYAYQALKVMGLTQAFAPVVVFCGHGGATENNAFASQLDCGACGGRSGGGNAHCLATMLNEVSVRRVLGERGIVIPESTRFISATHNTTTDEVVLDADPQDASMIELRQDLAKAREINNQHRLSSLTQHKHVKHATAKAKQRSHDWSQVRPEWGLARNAGFIVGPRSLTKGLDLDGRCFLHSYDESHDANGDILAAILTAPMVVAQWINAQYLFSTFNNAAYGAGSKVTKNITGKLGIMQGNASDLMTGLPLQSVFRSDGEPYHEPQRLLVVVVASPIKLSSVIAGQAVLQKLLGNGWVQLVSIDPTTQDACLLQRDFTWTLLSGHAEVELIDADIQHQCEAHP